MLSLFVVMVTMINVQSTLENIWISGIVAVNIFGDNTLTVMVHFNNHGVSECYACLPYWLKLFF